MTCDMRREELAIMISEDVNAMQEVLKDRNADDQRVVCALTAWLVNLGCIPELHDAVVHSVNGALRLIKNYGKAKP